MHSYIIPIFNNQLQIRFISFAVAEYFLNEFNRNIIAAVILLITIHYLRLKTEVLTENSALQDALFFMCRKKYMTEVPISGI